MTKAYTHVRLDLADQVAVEVFVTANPTHYGIGALIVAADGTICHVDAAGSCLVITSTELTP